MTTVIHGENLEVNALIERRHALGQDGSDEVWEGDYHVVPPASARHSRVQTELVLELSHRIGANRYYLTVEFNLGQPGDYRVPDLGIHSKDVTDLYVPTAVAVGEVLSPGDATYEKFGFYHSHDVQEILVVDPIERRIECWQRGATQYDESDIFSCAQITGAELTKLIRWP
jgi:hypothetical protein